MPKNLQSEVFIICSKTVLKNIDAQTFLFFPYHKYLRKVDVTSINSSNLFLKLVNKTSLKGRK